MCVCVCVSVSFRPLPFRFKGFLTKDARARMPLETAVESEFVGLLPHLMRDLVRVSATFDV